MVSDEEYGSLLSEYEGFRDAIMDEIAKLRHEIERLREDLKDMKQEVEEMKK